MLGYSRGGLVVLGYFKRSHKILHDVLFLDLVCSSCGISILKYSKPRIESKGKPNGFQKAVLMYGPLWLLLMKME